MENKEIKRSFWEVMKRFLEPYFDDKVILLKGFLVTFLWSSNSVVHVIFLERITYFLEIGKREIFSEILIYYLSYIFLFEISMFLTQNWGWVDSIPLSWKYISERYFRKFTLLNNNTVELEGTGKLIAIIGEGIKTWGLTLWSTVEQLMRLIVSVIFAFFMIAKLNIWFGIIFIILFSLFAFISTYFSNKLNYYRKKRNENLNIVYKHFAKIIMSKMEVLQTEKIDFEISNLKSLYENDRTINKKMSTNRTFMNRNADFLMGIFFVFSYYYLGNLYFKNEIALNIVVGFGGALILMQKSMSNALSFYIQLTKDFNLKLNGGKITAFVGNSGGGKTTLVKIISQYIKQDSGKVLIDGQDLNEISLKSYYKNIGYLTQEPSVFDGTILDNLTYALEIPLPNPPPKGEGTRTLSIPFSPGGKGWDRGMLEKIEKIIKLSKCEFIYDFEKGLETEIGERGVRLSGGQKQRLAIAKIMLKDPKIIILDEPTSALDSFSEELITKAMNNLFEGRTVLVIAHRLQTVKHADEIIVIEGGEIKERGKHNELVEKGGIYNRMLELQSGF